MNTATREAYGRALAELIVEKKDIVVLDADLTKSTKTIEAKKACPQRHFNMGGAESLWDPGGQGRGRLQRRYGRHTPGKRLFRDPGGGI